MSSLTIWKARTLVLHGFLVLVEAGLWASTAFLITRVHHSWIAPADGRSLFLLAIALTASFVIRSRKVWTHDRLYSNMEKARSKNTPSPFLIEDVIEKRGHFPDPERYHDLKNHLMEGRLPSHPFLFFLKSISSGLKWPALITLLTLSTAGLPSLNRSTESLHISLSPPDYLGLPDRFIDPREKSITVYPGTLIKIGRLPKSSALRDDQNRNYLSKRGETGWGFEARVLSPLTLKLTDPNYQLEINTLKDQLPKVTWTSTPPDRQFKTYSIAFRATDDHGLQETLVTVNGQEIEYAGDAQGRSVFSYRWDFDPSIHRPLLGGNVSLQIAAYDNDRVGGPKKSLSPEILWTFPGIQHLARQAIEKVESTRKATAKRLDKKQTYSAQELLQEVLEMSPLLRENPALSPALLGLNQSMALQLSSLTRNDSGQPNAQEQRLHQRHEWTLEMISQQAQQILSTIQASEWVQRLKDISDKASREEVTQEEWSETYDELREHFEKTDTQAGFKESMMRKLNQAELAAQMGDPETASKLLEEMAEQMRDQPSAMGSSGPNPMAERFQELLRELESLISYQDDNLKQLNNTHSELQVLQAFRMSIIRHPMIKAYQEWRAKVTQLQSKGEKIPRELISQNQLPGAPAYQGRMLQQVYRDLSLILREKKPLSPWPKASSLPEDLQEAWKKLLPSLDSISGQSYPKKMLGAQSEIADRGKVFRQEFESDIAPLLPGPFLGPLARQGETYSKRAQQNMTERKGFPLVRQDMQGATTSWKSLLQQLQKLQQAAQQAAGQQQQSLRIGEDGKLKLSQQGQPQNEGDGKFQQKDNDIEIPLPEDFQSNRAIEERLQESLRKTRNDEEMSRFKDYMLDLLE